MDLDLFQERSHHFKLETRVILTDIQRAFDRQVIKNYTSPTIETFSWKFYHNLEDIYQWMSDVSLRFPNFVELHSIGQSVEGRDIYAIYIRKAKGKGNVIVDAGIHGNEWISTAFVTYLIKKLVYVTPEENNRLYNLVMRYHWYLIPVVNPDGYDYSITTDRLWRKNRRLFETGEGVDLNRNFPHNFGKYDTSTNAKDDNYGGPGPFSEQESKVLSDFIIEKRDRLKFYLSFHSYGQKIIIPYDDRVKHVENFSEMDNYAKYVATFLLRDNGTFGYALPSEEILPTCEETLQGLVELMTARPRQCAQKKYYNYTLYRATPMNEKHIKFFKDLTSFYDVNYWRPPGQPNKVVELIVSPEDKTSFTKDAERLGIYLITIMDNVQKAFDDQTVKSYVRRKMHQFDWRSYFKTNDIYKWLFDLGNKYPQEVYLESIGKTLENRDIIAARIIIGPHKKRTKVIVEGGIHAREWIAPAFVTYMMNQIIQSTVTNNTALKEIAMLYEWYFIPLLNPDGYEISHSSDRLWRKNSRGVDLNRNFGIAFGTVGVSFSPWDDTYCGEHAFSERETSAMASFVRSKSDNLEYYLAFHSYGQFMILPYTFTKKHMDNFNDVHAMCKKAALRIADRHGTGFSIGTAYDTVGYLTSGVSGCWVKKTFKTPYVITFELRDEGYYGFALPPNEILPTCEETMDGVLSLLSPINKKTLKSKNGQPYNLLDRLVTLWNVILFILVRY
ncbi:zinc carboxypeptidase A 1-like [Battus philenor]|uniref:zinc carboxypeptidase A 1-like n=1 Tax=Battus philenor TaxID=42288 RepID=UPI0035CEC515